MPFTCIFPFPAPMLRVTSPDSPRKHERSQPRSESSLLSRWLLDLNIDHFIQAESLYERTPNHGPDYSHSPLRGVQFYGDRKCDPSLVNSGQFGKDIPCVSDGLLGNRKVSTITHNMRVAYLRRSTSILNLNTRRPSGAYVQVDVPRSSEQVTRRPSCPSDGM